MAKVSPDGRITPRRPGGSGTPGHAERRVGLAADALHIDRDGFAAADYFWKALERLRLALVAIEARFGLLPAPAPERDAAPRVIDGFRNVVASPPHAAETAGHMSLSGVRLQVANRLAEEENAAGKLPPQDLAAYRAVRDLVENAPEGRLALQRLVLSGRLTGSEAADGKGVWLHLGGLARQQLGRGIDRKQLVAQLLEELDDPAKIYQGNHNTCVPAVVAIMLARQKPAELVRLVSGLAAPGGEAALANGQIIRRVPDWQAPDGGRTVDQALFQPALIAYGVAYEGLTYDNTADRLSDGGNGLSVDEANVVLEGVTNRQSTVVQFYDRRDPAEIDRTLRHISDATARGLAVPVGLNWTGVRGHKILVERISGGVVHYVNPYGTREYMSLAELGRRITNANLPAL